MNQDLLIILAALGLLGSLAQWFSWWVKLPAILFLLLIGLIAGPVTGWFNPDAVFGQLLFPIVSLSVAVILFEGSLTLNLRELKGIEQVVLRLVSIGVAVTWLIITIATHYIMQLQWSLAMLFGALVVVTGPTVIVPMLRTVRPTVRIANILRWEGIVIDPVGALLAVLVFDFIVASQQGHGGLFSIALVFGKTIGIGILLGIAAGQLHGVILRRHLLPEYLHNVATLTLVFSVFALANHLQEESGLLAVTLMGMWLANMRNVPIEEILSFKESLSLLLISGLFIILAARIDGPQLIQMGWGALGVFLVIQFIARPIKVLVSTTGSSLSWQERSLLAWIAPRGIVAAAVSALFALKLEEAGFEQAPLMVSLTFIVIIGTVVLQSATARPLAIWLKVAEPEPRGILIVGANPVARAIALVLNEQGFRTLLTDSHWPNVQKALLDNLEAFWGNAISERADRRLDLVGIGQLFGLSQNDYLNVLAAQRYTAEFGRNKIYTLPAATDKTITTIEAAATRHRGNTLFGETVSYKKLASLIAQQAEIKTTKLSDTFRYEDYLEEYKGRVMPLFGISKRGNLRVCGNPENAPRFEAGWKVIGLIQPPEETPQQET